MTGPGELRADSTNRGRRINSNTVAELRIQREIVPLQDGCSRIVRRDRDPFLSLSPSMPVFGLCPFVQPVPHLLRGPGLLFKVSKQWPNRGRFLLLHREPGTLSLLVSELFRTRSTATGFLCLVFSLFLLFSLDRRLVRMSEV